MAGPPRLEQSAKLNIVVIIFKKIRRRPVARQQKGESVERKRGAKHSGGHKGGYWGYLPPPLESWG